MKIYYTNYNWKNSYYDKFKILFKCKKTKEDLDECKYDFGGYFIINGVEKVIVLQERCIDNKKIMFL